MNAGEECMPEQGPHKHGTARVAAGLGTRHSRFAQMLDVDYERLRRGVWTLARGTRRIGPLFGFGDRLSNEMRVPAEILQRRGAPCRDVALRITDVLRQHRHRGGTDLGLQHGLKELRLRAE